MHKKDRLDRTPAPPRESLQSTIQSKIPSLGPEQNRSTSPHSLPGMHFEYNTPATFPRVTQAVHMTEHRSFSAGLRCPPRAPSSDPPSRASRRYAMSSSSTSSSAPKATAKGLRLSVRGTASPGLTAKPGQPQGTSSPVASSTLLAAPPSPVASSTLRAISGSGTDRTRGLRPDSPVPPRAFMDDPLGPPAQFGCLHQVWDNLEPTLRARITSISLEAVETSLADARAAANIGDQARPAADACALAMAEEEHALVMRSLQARASSLDSAHADLWGRLRHCDTQRRSTATEIATAERHHRAFAATIGEGSRPPPPARAATRPAAPAASETFLAPTASQQRPTTPLPLYSTRLRPNLRALPHPRRLATLCPHRRHRPLARRSPPPLLRRLSLRSTVDSLHQPPETTATWTFACPS